MGTSQKNTNFFSRFVTPTTRRLKITMSKMGSLRLVITQTKHPLKGPFNCCLQPAVQKFNGFESQYKIKLRKNIENHLQKLIVIYRGRMKDNERRTPKKNSKYLEALLWLKEQSKFGSHFLSSVNPFQMIFWLVVIGAYQGSKAAMGHQMKKQEAPHWT